ncbi:MAG: hypothetical protein EOO52_12885 [Gammaproteobacteria bacterium]|nr:MAG: hypothetical protein EOO52_12885 [Gammaproteobacteria bacterium]
MSNDSLLIGSSDFNELKCLIEHALSESAIVLIEGKLNTGKSYVLHRLFAPENILATKYQGITTGNVAPRAIDRWKARIGNVAIDETGWLTDIQLDGVLNSAVSAKKGIVLGVQSIHRYREKIATIQKKYETPVLAITLLRFDRENQTPIWTHS